MDFPFHDEERGTGLPTPLVGSHSQRLVLGPELGHLVAIVGFFHSVLLPWWLSLGVMLGSVNIPGCVTLQRKLFAPLLKGLLFLV